MAKKGRTPSSNEISLWKKFTHGIQQIHDAFEDLIDSEPQSAKDRPVTALKTTLSNPSKPKNTTPQFNGFDRRTRQKLEKGNMPIEGRIDLHGKTQDQAKTTLTSFVTRAYTQKKRCLLVVTGKGSSKSKDHNIVSERSERGVIRKNLPMWLAQPPMNEMVISHIQAAPKDGGSGAFYIYLRNQTKN